MSKATFFGLAFILLSSVALATDHTGIRCSPLKKPEPKAMTAPQICVSRGHESACMDSALEMCSNLRCESRDGRVVSLGRAPDDTWCGTRRVCRAGRCIFQRTIPEPANNGGPYTMCL